MKKRVIGSGVAAAVIATTMALTPTVSDDVVDTSTAIVDEATEIEETAEKTAEDSVEEIKENSADSVETEKKSETTKTEHIEASLLSYEDYVTEIGYTLDGNNKHSKRLIIDVPDELSIDIAVLYVNDVEVDTALIPTQPSFFSIPIVFEKLENLEIKLYRMGEQVGSARFIDGILKTNAKAVV